MTINWEKYINQRFCYPIEVTKVYDGDTITCNIDLGFKIKLYKQKIRLFGINTPEVRGSEREEGLKSKQKLKDLIENKTVKLYSIKDKKGKYGRWLGIIYIDDLENSENSINCNRALLEGGYAKEALY